MRVLGALILAACLSCGGTRSYRAAPGPFDVLPAAERVPLRGARQALEAGDFVRAAAYLEPVTARHARNLSVRAFLQELELARLRAGLSVGNLRAPAVADDAMAILRADYVEQARARSVPELWILAARLEVDGGRALDYLKRAEALDPDCIWAYYGRAWWCFRLRRFQDARAAMDRSQELDPGHQPSLRLLAHMLAGSGDGPEAIRVLGLWLERAAADPLIPSAQRSEGLVDLALLRVLNNEPKEALELLQQLESIDPEYRFLEDVARMELVQAAALDLRGESEAALAASRRAALADSEILLPLVHEALLIQRSRPGTEDEKRAWERVLGEASEPAEFAGKGELNETEAGAPVDFDRLLLQLLARIHLGRLEEGEPQFMGMFAESMKDT